MTMFREDWRHYGFKVAWFNFVVTLFCNWAHRQGVTKVKLSRAR